MANARTDKWQHLVTGAFHLDETAPEALGAEARAYLRSVLEVFPKGLEPVDDFRAYAVRRLATAILRALESNHR